MKKIGPRGKKDSVNKLFLPVWKLIIHKDNTKLKLHVKTQLTNVVAQKMVKEAV